VFFRLFGLFFFRIHLSLMHPFYSAFREQQMRVGDGFLLVYSITSRNSFEEIPPLHRQVLRVKDRGEVPVVLCGNNCHKENAREVAKQEGSDMAKVLKCPFIETSSRQNIKVEDAFYQLVREIWKHERRLEQLQRQRTDSISRKRLSLDVFAKSKEH